MSNEVSVCYTEPFSKDFIIKSETKLTAIVLVPKRKETKAQNDETERLFNEI